MRTGLVVAVLGANSLLIAGSSAVTIGLIINPLMTEFGWSNSLTSSVATSFNLTGVVMAPLVGVALDRLGAKLIMFMGIALISAGLLLASDCHTWHMMMIAFAITGLGFCASFYVPSAVLVSNWLGQRRNLGMGIIMGAMSIGAALFSVLVGRWAGAYGWRTALQLDAALAALMLPVVLMAIRNHPAGFRPGQERAAPEVGSTAARVDSKAPLDRKLFFSPVFVLAVAGSALFSMGMGGIYFHVVPVLLKAGFSSYWAGVVFGSTWIFSGLGSLVLGVMADRFGAKVVLAWSLLSCAAGSLLLLGAGAAGPGTMFAAGFVVLWGVPANSVAQFIPVVFAERFASRFLGTLIGVELAIAGVAGAVTPVVTGLLYDRFQDYRAAIYLSAALMLVAVVMVLFINGKRALNCAPTAEKLQALVQ